MQGLNATTGQSLAGLDHLRQSIADILTTPTPACAAAHPACAEAG